jgi:hypothetical protein
VTLAEHYGIPQDEGITDVDWLELAGTNAWVVFMKDARSARPGPFIYSVHARRIERLL